MTVSWTVRVKGFTLIEMMVVMADYRHPDGHCYTQLQGLHSAQQSFGGAQSGAYCSELDGAVAHATGFLSWCGAAGGLAQSPAQGAPKYNIALPRPHGDYI